MDPNNTGVSPQATVPGDGGAGPVVAPDPGDATPQAATPAPVQPPAQAGADTEHATQIAQLEKQLDEMRNVQSGDQRKITSLTEERDELVAGKAKLEAEVQRLNDVAIAGDDVKAKYEQDLQDARSAAETQATELSEQIANLNVAVEALQQENERLKVIVGEFPQLAALLEADALPQAQTLDEFRQKLTTLGERFVPSEQAAAQARLTGQVPPASPPRGSGAADMDGIYEQLKAAQRAGDQAEVERLTELWHQTAEAEGLVTTVRPVG